MRAGRKKKPNVIRDAKGKWRGERPEDVMSVAILQRRRLVEAADAINALAGSVLGRLFLLHGRGAHNQGISRRQYEAGERYADVVREHAMVMGLPVGWLEGASGVSTRAAPEPEVVEAIRRRFAACHVALVKVERVQREPVERIVRAVTVHDRELEGAVDLAVLRAGLDALADVLE